MKEYMFYTTEGVTLNPYGDVIENCQVLGRAIGECKTDALSNLLSENPWITANGYDWMCFLAVELVT